MLDNATYTPRLKTLYKETICGALKEEFGYKNDMQLPKLEKIVLNIGCGRAAVRDSKKSQIRSGRSFHHRWPESSDHRGKELHRWLPRS